MFVFNTSFYVQDAVFGLWRQWVEQEMLPALAAGGWSQVAEVFEVVSAVPDAESRIFSVQWRCGSDEQVAQLDEVLVPQLEQCSLKFGQKATHFSTLMKSW